MQTAESIRASRLFGGTSAEGRERSFSSLSSFFLAKTRAAGANWPSLIEKEGTVKDRELMFLALSNGEETEIQSIGKGIHRPYRVLFARGIQIGPVSTRQAVMKTMYCQYENKRYCESVDLSITGPERERLSYELDKVIGFNLVPPTVVREIASMGIGSIQAWVDRPTAWEWHAKGYDYRKDLKNPWLHRLAAFDFIRGEIDRHANNWIMDETPGPLARSARSMAMITASETGPVISQNRGQPLMALWLSIAFMCRRFGGLASYATY